MVKKEMEIKKQPTVQFPVEFLCEEAGITGYKKEVFILKEKLKPDQTMTREEFARIYQKRYGVPLM